MTQRETAPQAQTVHKATTQSLLDEVLSRPVSERQRSLDDWFHKNVDRIEELLPKTMKGEGYRLAKRAMVTFSKNPQLHEADAASFVRCVLEAAEMGLAIDGKLCHAVVYNTKVPKTNRWVKSLQCQPDYKGLIAVAKRTGQIIDADAGVVRANDRFVHGKAGASCRLEHSWDHRLSNDERGEIVCCWARLFLPGGRWTYELMPIADVWSIRNRSQSWKAHVEKGYQSPWANDESEMVKKTVLRRSLKLYADDPGLVRALEIDDADYDVTGVPVAPRQDRSIDTFVRDTLDGANGNGDAAEAPQGDDSDLREWAESAVGDTDDASESDAAGPEQPENDQPAEDDDDLLPTEAHLDTLETVEQVNDFEPREVERLPHLKAEVQKLCQHRREKIRAAAAGGKKKTQKEGRFAP